MSETPGPSPASAARVPVPARLHAAPVAASMVVPYITAAHLDRTRPAWGKLDPRRLHDCWTRRLCQICGDPLTDPVVIYLRPSDYQRGIVVEPGMHPECGHYSRRVCPMLAGSIDRYNPHPVLHRCAEPDCDCRVWTPPEPDPRQRPREGQPTEAWYEAWIALHDYQVVHDPGDEDVSGAIGISVHPTTRIRRLRRIRDAAPALTHRADPLAAIVLTRALFGHQPG